jgi:hypothetical protein
MDPVLVHDEATGFYTERHEMTIGGKVYVTYRAYPDHRWVYHLHRGNTALGDTAQDAIDALAAKAPRAWAIAA